MSDTADITYDYNEDHRIEARWLGRERFSTPEEWSEAVGKSRTEARRAFIRYYVPPELDASWTDKGRLPDPAAFDLALVEQTEEEAEKDIYIDGRYLYGPTGTGKTRCAVQYAEQKVQRGEAVYWWPAYALKQKLFGLRNDAEEKERFVGEISDRYSYLFIDDFGHHISESFLEVVRVVLENRSCCNVVVTSQYSLEEFVERCHEKGMGRLAEAIARRLFEGCKRIQFRRGRRGAAEQEKRPPGGCAEETPADRIGGGPDVEGGQ